MDFHIAFCVIVTIIEVWTLRSMGYNMIGQHSPQGFCELDYPISSCSSFHGSIIFIIKINTINIMIEDIFSKLSGTLGRIISLASRMFCSSESTNQQFDTSIVILLLQYCTGRCWISCSEKLGSNIADRIIPNFYSIKDSVPT